jgi:DNA-binding MarR family transcriptional regulator
MPQGERLDTQAGQILLMALFSTVRRLRARDGGEAVDLPSIYVLNVVREHPGIRVSELAGNVGLDASTVSRHIRSLEAVGYLSRVVDPKDRRASCLELTEDGEKVILQAFETRATLILAAMDAWSDEDRERFTELCVRFAGDFDRVAPH